MKIPDVYIEEILFEKLIDKQALIAFNYLLDERDFSKNGDFNEIIGLIHLDQYTRL